jgi:hypothetical protein
MRQHLGTIRTSQPQRLQHKPLELNPGIPMKHIRLHAARYETAASPTSQQRASLIKVL